MITAAAANEYKSNISLDYCLEGELADFEAKQELDDVDAMTMAQRRALNAAMAEWYGIG